MREKAVCENTNLLDAHARVQTKRNEPTESRTLKLEPKNLKGRNRRKPEDIVFNNELTQQTNTQSQQVASASKHETKAAVNEMICSSCYLCSASETVQKFSRFNFLYNITVPYTDI